jgi:hypothetical protein
VSGQLGLWGGGTVDGVAEPEPLPELPVPKLRRKRAVVGAKTGMVWAWNGQYIRGHELGTADTLEAATAMLVERTGEPVRAEPDPSGGFVFFAGAPSKAVGWFDWNP